MFGDQLVTAPYREGEQELPSPNQLRHKIILKNKKIESQLQSHQQKGGGAVEEDEYDSDFEEEMMEDDDEDEDSENSVMTMEEYLKSMHGR